tara:strand:+ start:1614 stop:1826 length:213 start_codon:yes stop_codon:yes gene_type:complete
MKMETTTKDGHVLGSFHVAGTVDEVSAMVLNEEATRLCGESVEIGDGDNDYLYFFNANAEQKARVNIYEA